VVDPEVASNGRDLEFDDLHQSDGSQSLTCRALGGLLTKSWTPLHSVGEGCCRFRAGTSWISYRSPTDAPLFGVIFLLLAGEKALEILWAPLLVCSRPSLQEGLTNLRNAAAFSGSDCFEAFLQT
jgi:hypothetical protein